MLARHESHEVERVVLQCDERASEVEVALQVRYLEDVVELSQEVAHDGCFQRRHRVPFDGERDEHQRPAALAAFAQWRLYVRDGDAACTECVHDAQAVERRHRVVAGLDLGGIVDLAEHRREPVPGRARVGAEDVDRLLHQAVADPRIPLPLVDRDVREQSAVARRVVLRGRETDDLVEPPRWSRDDEVQEWRCLAACAPERIAMRLEVLPLLVPREAALVEATGRMDRRQQLVAGDGRAGRRTRARPAAGPSQSNRSRRSRSSRSDAARRWSIDHPRRSERGQAAGSSSTRSAIESTMRDGR